MSWLAYDGKSLLDSNHKLYEVTFWQGIWRLLQPWKFYLHHTMGRPVIKRWKQEAASDE